LQFDHHKDEVMQDWIVQLVDRMLDLHRKKNQAKTDSEKELFKHQIKATDTEIDELVYKLYGLNEEEVGIVKSL
jgi:adenine-specific DNA-methyltransferase